MTYRSLICVGLLAAATQLAWADASATGCDRSSGRAAGCTLAAPEIDAAGGFNAIALLGGILALISERRRRSRK